MGADGEQGERHGVEDRARVVEDDLDGGLSRAAPSRKRQRADAAAADRDRGACRAPGARRAACWRVEEGVQAFRPAAGCPGAAGRSRGARCRPPRPPRRPRGRCSRRGRNRPRPAARRSSGGAGGELGGAFGEEAGGEVGGVLVLQRVELGGQERQVLGRRGRPRRRAPASQPPGRLKASLAHVGGEEAQPVEAQLAGGGARWRAGRGSSPAGRCSGPRRRSRRSAARRAATPSASRS